MDFIAGQVSRGSWVNVMDQYRPCFGARRIPELSRPVTRSEYRAAVALARRAGLSRGLPEES
jgi:putative pyruvate formate lyase activating enzyme